MKKENFYQQNGTRKLLTRNQRILQLRKKGYSLAGLAKVFEISPQRIGQIIERYEIKFYKNHLKNINK